MFDRFEGALVAVEDELAKQLDDGTADSDGDSSFSFRFLFVLFFLSVLLARFLILPPV
jgi:hypothetical protein